MLGPFRKKELKQAAWARHPDSKAALLLRAQAQGEGCRGHGQLANRQDAAETLTASAAGQEEY